MGAFAFTGATLPGFVEAMVYAICALGLATAVTTIAGMLVMAAQGERPKRFIELERNVRIAKGDAGKRVRIELKERRAERPREPAEDDFGESIAIKDRARA